MPSESRVLASLLLAVSLAMTAACGDKSRSPGSADAAVGADADPSADADAGVPDGGFVWNYSADEPGNCVLFEPIPGYEVCLLDRPQGPGRLTTTAQFPQPSLFGPSSVDLRADHLRFCVQEDQTVGFKVHWQGTCGWCVAHTVTGAMEAQRCVDEGVYEPVSVPHLWYVGHGKTDFTTCKGGWFLHNPGGLDALQSASSEALVDADRWPSRADDLVRMNAERPSDNELECFARHRITDYQIVTAGPGDKVATAKGLLADRHFVMLQIPVFRNTGWQWGGDALVVRPGVTPSCSCDDPSCTELNCVRGYHAVFLVGYDDASATFEFVNSWSSGWGDGGYGRFDYSFIEAYAPNWFAYVTEVEQRRPSGELVFLRQDAFGTGTVWKVRDDGTGETQLSFSTEWPGDWCPALSPDRSKVAFRNWNGTVEIAQLFVMSMDGASWQAVPNTEGLTACPLWWDDTHVLIVAGGSTELIDINTGARTTLFELGCAGQLSPDLTQMACDRRVFNPTLGYNIAQIFVQDMMVGGWEQITFGTEWADEPSWSPDGDRLVFRSGSDLHFINPDGSAEVTFLTGVLGQGLNWHKDGRILFANNEGPIEIVDVDGSNRTQLTNPDLANFEWDYVPDGNAPNSN